MFKNLMIYRLGPEWPSSADQWAQALAAEPFAECGPTQPKSSGWMPPRGVEHGALVEAVDGQWIARFVLETKSVPAEAVRRHAQAAADEIERSTGRKPGKRELRDLRDDAVQALLPQAFARRSQLNVWIEPRQRWLVLDTGSQAKADELISSLVRVAGRGFEVSLLQTATTPQAAMSSWLADESGDALPPALGIERECELKASGEEPAVIKFTRHPLQIEEVRQHIREGKLPTRLALNWQGRVGFTLTQALQIKKIRFDEGVYEGGGTPTQEDERFDADAALATGELGALIADLLQALGGEAAPIAPSPMPAAPGESQPQDDPPF